MAPLQALLFDIEFKHAQCCEQKDDVSIFAWCSRCDMTGQFVPQDFDVSYLAKGGWQHLCFSASDLETSNKTARGQSILDFLGSF